MAIMTDEYKKLVLEDLKTYGTLCRPLKAPLFERALIKNVSIKKLHPNPDDEFSDPSIGPNYGIVSNYEQKFVQERKERTTIVEDPLVVEKMSTGGYMILNGHHRWLAAAKVGKKRMKVEIVNATHDEEIIAAVTDSNRDLCVSFDLDEVLLSTRDARPLPFPFSLIYHQNLRRNAGLLIKELQRLGFDIWIYTGSYYSKQYVDLLFKLNRSGITGLVNGLQKKKTGSEVKKAFTDKYRLSVHADNDSLLLVDTRTKNYKSFDLPGKGDWANEVHEFLRDHLCQDALNVREELK